MVEHPSKMKHSNSSGNVRFHPQVDEIEKDNNDRIHHEKGTKDHLKPISSRRATGYVRSSQASNSSTFEGRQQSSDLISEERRQIQQLINERDQLSDQLKASEKKNMMNKNDSNIVESKKSTELKRGNLNEKILNENDQHSNTKRGFGAKLADAMRLGKRHEHSDRSEKKSALNARNSTINLSENEEDENSNLESSKFMTAPTMTEAFAPIFADANVLFLPSHTYNANKDHHFHKNLRNLPKGNSGFAAIVESAYQRKIVENDDVGGGDGGGGSVEPPKRTFGGSKKHKERRQIEGTKTNSNNNNVDEELFSEEIRLRLHKLASAAKVRVRQSALYVAEAMADSNADTNTGTDNRNKISRSHSRKHSTGTKAQSRPSRSHTIEGREDRIEKEVDRCGRITDLPQFTLEPATPMDDEQQFESKLLSKDDIIQGEAAFKIVEKERKRTGNQTSRSHSKGEVIWIGRDGQVIEDPNRSKKIHSRQPSKYPKATNEEDQMILNSDHQIEATTPSTVKSTNRPSLDNPRNGEHRHHRSHRRNLSDDLDRTNALISDEVEQAILRRASEDSVRNERHLILENEVAGHRHRSERSHRHHPTNFIEDDEKENYLAQQQQKSKHRSSEERGRSSSHHHRRHHRDHSRSRTPRKDTSNGQQQIENSAKQTIISTDLLKDETRMNKKPIVPSPAQQGHVEQEETNNQSSSHHKFKILRALGHAMTLGHPSNEDNIQKEDDKDLLNDDEDDYDGNEEHQQRHSGDGGGGTGEGPRKRLGKLVDVQDETRLNMALDIARTIMETELLEAQAEKKRHQTIALTNTGNEKGIDRAKKTVQTIAQKINVSNNNNNHHYHHQHLASASNNETASSTTKSIDPTSIEQTSSSSVPLPSAEQQKAKLDEAYEEALRREIKQKKERIKTSQFINDQNVGIHGLC